MLKRQHIRNAKRRVDQRADCRPLLPNVSFRDDVDAARAFLQDNQWLHDEFTVPDAKQEMRWGIVFANPRRLEILKARRLFTQFNATHKMNKWGYNLYSFLIRNEYGVWILAIRDRQWRDASRCGQHGERGQCNCSRCR